MINHLNQTDREVENRCTTLLTKAVKPTVEKNLALKLNTVIQTFNSYININLNATRLYSIFPEIRKQIVDLNECRLLASRIIDQYYFNNIANDILDTSKKTKRKHSEIENSEDLELCSSEDNVKQMRLSHPSLYPEEKIREYLQTLEINEKKIQEEIIRLLHNPHSDLTFICRDHSFKFHSALLKEYIFFIAAATSYESSKTHHVFDLKEFEESENLYLSSDRILKFLVWLYTGHILLETEDAFELARFVNIISDREDLFKIFKDYLNEQPSLCLPLFLAMQGNPSMHMKQIIKEICCDHSKHVFDNPAFLELPFDFLVEMFSLDLKLTTDDVLFYLSKWVKHHKSLDYFENSTSPILIEEEEGVDEDENSLSEEEGLKDGILTQLDTRKLLEKCLDLDTLNKHRSFIIEKFFITEKQFETIIVLKENQDIQFNLRSNMPFNAPTPFIVRTLSEDHALIKWKTLLNLSDTNLKNPNIGTFKTEKHKIKINHESYEFSIGCDVKEEFDPLAPPNTPSYCVKPRFYIMIQGVSADADIERLEIDLHLQSDQSAVWDLITTSTPSSIKTSNDNKYKTFYFDCRNTFQYALKTQTVAHKNYYNKYKQSNYEIQVSINIKTKENLNNSLANANNILNLIALTNLSNSVINTSSILNNLHNIDAITFKANIVEIKKNFLDYFLQFTQLLPSMLSFPDAPIRPDFDATYLYKAEQLDDKTWTYPIKLQKTLRKLYGEGMAILDLKNSVAFRESAEFAVEVNGVPTRYHSFILDKYPVLSNLQAYVLEHNLSLDAVEKIIEYLYTDTIILTEEDIVDIYYTALFLKFDKLETLCYTKLKSKDFLKADTALQLAQRINIGPKLKKFELNILVFVRDHFYNCFFTNDNELPGVESIRPIFYKVKKEVLLILFKNAHLNASEACIFLLMSEFLKNDNVQYNSCKETHAKLQNCTLSFYDYFRYEIQKELLSTLNFKLFFEQNLLEALALMQNAKIKDIQIFTNEEILNLQVMAYQSIKTPISSFNQKFIEDTIDKPIRHYDIWKTFKLNRNDSYAIKQEKDFVYFIWEIVPRLTNEVVYLEKSITFLNQQFNIGYRVEKENENYKINFLIKIENPNFTQLNSIILEKIHFNWTHVLEFDEENNYLAKSITYSSNNINNEKFINIYSYYLKNSPNEWQNKKMIQRFMLMPIKN